MELVDKLIKNKFPGYFIDIIEEINNYHNEQKFKEIEEICNLTIKENNLSKIEYYIILDKLADAYFYQFKYEKASELYICLLLNYDDGCFIEFSKLTSNLSFAKFQIKDIQQYL
jgi:hypothetical protein